jgi:hypothetical protein
MVNRSLKDRVKHSTARVGLYLSTTRAEAARQSQVEDLVRQIEGWYEIAVGAALPPRGRRPELLSRLQGTPVSEALYLIDYLHRSLIAGGDVCEFGVAQGFTSALIANEIVETDRVLWLYDSFEGLSKPTSRDELINDISSLRLMERYEGAFAYGETSVRHRLAGIGFPSERLRVVRGFLDEMTTAHSLPARVCFAYLDMDLYEPTRIGLALLQGRLQRGGVIMVDDYGFFSAGPKSAVDEFLEKNRGEYELLVPSGVATGFCILSRR